jgi:hypothetical protein
MKRYLLNSVAMTAMLIAGFVSVAYAGPTGPTGPSGSQGSGSQATAQVDLVHIKEMLQSMGELRMRQSEDRAWTMFVLEFTTDGTYRKLIVEFSTSDGKMSIFEPLTRQLPAAEVDRVAARVSDTNLPLAGKLVRVPGLDDDAALAVQLVLSTSTTAGEFDKQLKQFVAQVRPVVASVTDLR